MRQGHRTLWIACSERQVHQDVAIMHALQGHILALLFIELLLEALRELAATPNSDSKLQEIIPIRLILLCFDLWMLAS